MQLHHHTVASLLVSAHRIWQWNLSLNLSDWATLRNAFLNSSTLSCFVNPVISSIASSSPLCQHQAAPWSFTSEQWSKSVWVDPTLLPYAVVVPLCAKSRHELTVHTSCFTTSNWNNWLSTHALNHAEDILLETDSLSEERFGQAFWLWTALNVILSDNTWKQMEFLLRAILVSSSTHKIKPCMEQSNFSPTTRTDVLSHPPPKKPPSSASSTVTSNMTLAHVKAAISSHDNPYNISFTEDTVNFLYVKGM